MNWKNEINWKKMKFHKVQKCEMAQNVWILKWDKFENSIIK